MRQTTIRDAKKSLKAVAREEGVSLQEVRREIENAMRAGMASDDPEIQRRWSMIPHKGEHPTPEEFIAYMSNMLRDHSIG